MIRWFLLLISFFFLNIGRGQITQLLFPWCKDGQLCYIDTIGEIHATQETQLKYPRTDKNLSSLIPYREFINYGFKDRTDKIIIPATFEKVGTFQEGITWVKLDHKRFYYINEKQEPIIQYTFDRCYDFQEGRGRVLDHNSSKGYQGFGFIDKKGEVVIPLIYQDAMDFEKGYALVKDHAGWWLIDKNGQKLYQACTDLIRDNNIFRIENR